MLVTVVALLLGLAIGLTRNEPLLWPLIGLLLGWAIAMQRSLWRLETALEALKTSLARPGHGIPGAPAAPTGPSPARPAPPMARPIARVPQASNASALAASAQPVPAPASPPPPGVALVERLVSWLQSGNLFLRVGILVLFFGVAFLIKYAVERDILVFTPQMRLAGIGAAGLGLIGLGGFLARGRRDYGLLLQGAGIGILYLDAYGAYELYQLLPAGAAFTALVLIGLLAAGLALFQDAPALAWFGFTGGFLAPLAAGGLGTAHVKLFGLYALLDAAILGVAWFKHWRALNLLGFAFTFGIAGLWGALHYVPALFPTTQPFLILFFLFFVVITILYTLRQPPQLKGWIDASLLFGTPALCFTYQVALIGHIAHGIEASAATLGGFYLMLALLIRPWSEHFALLARAFQVLGAIFLSIAVPYALSESQTAGVWALEGAGMVWIGTRQRRPSIRALGLLLQAGAAIALVQGYPYPDTTPFLNAFYPAAAMLAVAGAVSSHWLDRLGPERQGWERGGAVWLLLWAIGWWFGAGVSELRHAYPSVQFPTGLLLYAAFTALLAELAATLWPWPRLRLAQTALPLAGIGAFAMSIGVLSHPSLFGGAYAWVLLLATCWLVLARAESRAPHPSLFWGHIGTGLLLVVVLQWELLWHLIERWQLREGWRVAGLALIPTLALQLAMHAGGWPLARWRTAYALVLGGTLAAFVALWGVWSASSPGGAAPLIWLPILNPADLMLALVLLTLYQWARLLHQRLRMNAGLNDEPLIWIILGGLGLLWLNLVLLRTMHHWWGVPYEAHALLRSVPTQMAVSVLWGLTGVGLLLSARRTVSRHLWFVGAGVLVAVVAKLFLIDLAASGTLERIISFLAVGTLLMGVGWFAQLPPRRPQLRAPEAIGDDSPA